MGTWNFSYDAVDRLTSATPGSNAPSQYSGKYGCWNYDAFGNRTLESFSIVPCTGGNPTPQIVASYNSANQIISTGGTTSATFAYDTSGNTLYDGLNRYWYDAEGQLCAEQSTRTNGASIFQYVYDAGGARIAKGTIATAPASYTATCAPPLGSGFTLTSWYLVDQGGDQVTELNASGVWQHSNVFVAGKLSATWDYNGGSGGLHFRLTDPLGTMRVQANAHGQVEETCTSLPFGNDIGNPIGANCGEPPSPPSTADDATEHHFTGKERDAESGNDYFMARYYNSAMGRFLSPDWAAKEEPVPYAKLDNPQTLNLYSYVQNNPLSHVDADGHCAEDACVVEGGTALIVGAIALTAGTEAYLSTPSGQRSLSTFTSGVSSSFSNSVSSIKNFFSSSKATPAPAAPVGATPATPTAAPAVPGTQSNQPKSNPMTGTPGSTSQTTQPDGSPKQVRRYGPDGHPETDVDHGHDHGQGDPHAHDWGRPSDGSAPTHTDRGPGRPVTPNDPKPQP